MRSCPKPELGLCFPSGLVHLIPEGSPDLRKCLMNLVVTRYFLGKLQETIHSMQLADLR